MHNREKGKLGEEIAAKYLIGKGYRIVERNWNCRWGELDIIASKGDTTVFVEVKYRTSLQYGEPEYSVHFKKYTHMIRTIQMFLSKHRHAGSRWRIDVITGLKTSYTYLINHYTGLYR